MPSAYLQWRFHSGERVVARGPLVSSPEHEVLKVSYCIQSLSVVCHPGMVGCGEGVGCLSHRGDQLILASSWNRHAILVAGKGRGEMFLFLLFLHFHSCSSFFPIPPFHLLISSIFFLPFSGRQHKMTYKG